MRGRTKKILLAVLIVWVAFSVILHILPVPRNLDYDHWAYEMWGFYTRNVATIQSIAHALLMGVLSFIIMHFLVHRHRVEAFVLVMTGTLLFTVGMEYLQSALPFCYGRTADPADLVSGMSGALVGSLAGLGLPRSLRAE